VELAQVNGFELKNWHLIGPFEQALSQLDTDPEHGTANLPVHAVRNVEIALPVIDVGNFVKGVQLRDEVAVVEHMIWAIRPVLAVLSSALEPAEIWRINGSLAPAPADGPLHAYNLKTVNLSYAQQLVLRAASPSHSVLVRHLVLPWQVAPLQSSEPFTGNIALKDGQDRTLTGRQTLHLIWVDQEELWYEV
jgi:hypothetical protein